jgi:uncharacterized protein (DUF1778 family)
MAVIHKKNAIILTEETGRDFIEKLNNPDKEIIKKRNAFLKECKETVEVTKRDGKTFINFK